MKGGSSSIILFVLACVLLCSGCLEQTALQKETDDLLAMNTPPRILECRVQYFDTSDSLTVYFVGVGTDDDGNITRYLWSLSDGFRTNDPSFVHTFSHPGTYLARLTITDDGGAINTSSITVYVYDSTAQDEQRIIGKWHNDHGTIIEFTEDGRYISYIESTILTDYYWFADKGLYIHSTESDETLRYEYSFANDGTLTFFVAGSSPTTPDIWTRVL